jgi:hypothetical protein
MERWYDKHKNLRKYLESLREINQEEKDSLLRDLLNIIKKHNPELFSPEKSLEFPLELHRRRWYDRDPNLWLLMNTLQIADKRLLKKVTDYLQKNLEL